MKLINKTIYALALTGMLGLWSCQSEDIMTDSASGEPVPVTITVYHGDASTRTELSANSEGGLDDKWLAGDEIKVYNPSSEEVGTLTLQSGEDTNKGVFTGEITGGAGEYYLWYFGVPTIVNGEKTYPRLSFDKEKRIGVKFANPKQNFKSVKELSELDILKQKVTLSIYDGKGYVTENVLMTPVVGLVHFTLTGLDKKNGTLTISNQSDLTFITTGRSWLGASNGGAGNIVSQGGIQIDIDEYNYDDEGNAHVYFGLWQNAYKLALNFTAIDGSQYSYTFENQTNVKAGSYYCSSDGSSGIEINMVEDEQDNARLHLLANFSGQMDTEIVLEGNFGEPFDLSSKDYTSYMGVDGSKLPNPPEGYEFIGWSQTRDGSIDNSVTIESPKFNDHKYYAIWLDHSHNPLLKWAEGDLIRSGSGKGVTGSVSNNPWISGSYYQFGRNYGYNSASEVTLLSTEASLSNNYFTYRGVAYKSVPENGVYLSSSQKVQKNQNTTVITKMSDHPDMFFMNSGDYVSPAYTESWDKRAKNTNGYTNETPCPSGWTIPSKADFEEILPINGNEIGSKSWETKTQIKLIGDDEIPCAFRWSKENNALKIECIVIASKDDSPDWSNKNVVTRYFKLSGCLTSFMQSGVMTQGNNRTVQYVANVLNFGIYDTNKQLGNVIGNTNVWYMSIYRISDYMNDTGFYWTCDADQEVFTLNTNSGITSYPNVGYYFTKPTVTIGANIRCIKSNI